MINKAPEHPRQLFRLKKSSLLQLSIFVFAMIVLVPQIGQFSESWSHISTVSIPWLILALLAMLLTMIFAALVYMVLVPTKLKFKTTLLIQLATYFTNRLLPSGLGGIGFNALYLTKKGGLTRTDSAVYATANNLIGFIAFSLCIGLASVVGDSDLSFSMPRSLYIFIGLGVIFVVIITALMVKSLQKRIIDFLGHMFGVALTIIKHPKRLLFSVLLSTGITLSYVLMLWASTKSVDINISIIDLFIAFVVGNAALTLSPTPGGIGAVEAAITAVLVSAGTSASLALASVVIFRMVSYWAPILPGYFAFRMATKRHYV